ncbi:MAG TPA: alpha/beta fold hydrolase [Polyangia bacterium]|jgi:2-succinyl-6-hydroxy-2,4-cyclohexadiene-1-carboxylate synthase|nr:alpha/beta fold hydrolase [Polyangia bacterium]
MTLPLVLLHGFTGDAESWAEVRARLPGTRSVWCPPILGHDLSLRELERDATACGFVAEVDRLAAGIAARFDAPVHVAGYSLGGRLALALVARHTRLFGRATLIGAHPGLTKPEARVERVRGDEQWAELLEKQGMAAFVSAWEAQPLFSTQERLDKAVRERVRAHRLTHRPEGLALAMRALGLGRMPRLSELCAGAGTQPAALDLPVELLVGEEDARFCALARELAATLPRARVTIVPNAGHNLPLEVPGAVAAALSKEEP